MYNELFTIGNYTVTGYGLCLALAIIAAYFTTELGIRYYKLDINVALPMVASAVIPGFIGAKGLYLIQIADKIKADPSIISKHIIDGFVIYGGIVVAIPSVYLCLKLMKVDILQYMDIGIASIAIAQAIGRVGCYLAGCCHGKEVASDYSIAVTYTNSSFAVNYVSYFPIQLVCVVLNIINFVFLLALNKHVKIKGVTLFSYMITYGIGRFILEFFRGDEIRGFIGPLSVSQFISLFVATIGIIACSVCIIKHNKNNKETEKLKTKTVVNQSRKRRKSK